MAYTGFLYSPKTGKPIASLRTSPRGPPQRQKMSKLAHNPRPLCFIRSGRIRCSVMVCAQDSGLDCPLQLLFVILFVIEVTQLPGTPVSLRPATSDSNAANCVTPMLYGTKKVEPP